MVSKNHPVFLFGGFISSTTSCLFLNQDELVENATQQAGLFKMSRIKKT